MGGIHEVAVVGAGPAGSSTAIEYLERKPGGDVLLLEGIKRASTLEPGQPGAGHSMCSGGLPHMLIQRMVGWDIPPSVVMSTVRRARVRGPGSSLEIDGSYLGIGKDLGIITNRKKLDDWLLGWARKLGAEYRNDARVTSYRREDGHWVLTLRGGEEHRARFLVGADGPESQVAAQFLGAPPIPDEDMYLGSEVYVPRGKFPDDLVLFQWTNSRIQGYYWAFGAGDVAKIGLCTTRASGVNPGKENQWWRARMAEEFGDPGFLGPALEAVGGRITASAPLKQVVDPKAGVAVVGEAARAVWAEIAAGDAPAFETGRALGRCLAAGDPKAYQRWWRRKSYPILSRHYRFKTMMLGMSDADFDRGIRMLGGFRPPSTNVNRNALSFLRYALMRDPLLFARVVRGAFAAPRSRAA